MKMLFEICIIVYIMYNSITTWLINPYDLILHGFGGKTVKQCFSGNNGTKNITNLIMFFFLSMFMLFNSLVTGIVMLWLSSRGIILAFYYLMFILGIAVLRIGISGLRLTKTDRLLPLKASFWDKSKRLIFFLIEMILCFGALAGFCFG